MEEKIEQNKNLIQALEDRHENSGKHFKVKIDYYQEDKIPSLYFNCLDLFEVKELIAIMALNYRIHEIKIKEY